MILSNRFRKAVAAAALALPLLLTAVPASAITIVPDCARHQGKEAADLNCVLATFENIANLILGITGSFALLMFVYGGFTLLSSGGAEQKVTKGKTIIVNAVIGILIIMLAGYLVRYGVATMKGKGTLTAAGEECGEETNRGGTLVKKRMYKIGNNFACVSECGEISGYSCTTETAGKNCLIGLCGGTQNNRCCPN